MSDENNITPEHLIKKLFPRSWEQYSQHGVTMYFNDWRNTGLSVEQYKRLLVTRG